MSSSNYTARSVNTNEDIETLRMNLPGLQKLFFSYSSRSSWHLQVASFHLQSWTSLSASLVCGCFFLPREQAYIAGAARGAAERSVLYQVYARIIQNLAPHVYIIAVQH